MHFTKATKPESKMPSIPARNAMLPYLLFFTIGCPTPRSSSSNINQLHHLIRNDDGSLALNNAVSLFHFCGPHILPHALGINQPVEAIPRCFVITNIDGVCGCRDLNAGCWHRSKDRSDRMVMARLRHNHLLLLLILLLPRHHLVPTICGLALRLLRRSRPPRPAPPVPGARTCPAFVPLHASAAAAAAAAAANSGRPRSTGGALRRAHNEPHLPEQPDRLLDLLLLDKPTGESGGLSFSVYVPTRVSRGCGVGIATGSSRNFVGAELIILQRGLGRRRTGSSGCGGARSRGRRLSLRTGRCGGTLRKAGKGRKGLASACVIRAGAVLRGSFWGAKGVWGSGFALFSGIEVFTSLNRGRSSDLVGRVVAGVYQAFIGLESVALLYAVAIGGCESGARAGLLRSGHRCPPCHCIDVSRCGSTALSRSLQAGVPRRPTLIRPAAVVGMSSARGG
ncbi:hypothetical protein VTJ83DRAFT_323 [Remersonia thermophila]|uniref:Uncharacterized protein n=1 Tax=Remersonia thermophila TaxID=72144 RepID=A0ABR4DKV9_9PEZI